MSVIIALGFLVLAVVAHEMGHFLAGMAVGIKPKEFGIGFPVPFVPSVSRTWKGIKFSFYLTLLGGFNDYDDDLLWSLPVGRRILLLLGGWVANIYLAFFLSMLLTFGTSYPAGAVVNQLSEAMLTDAQQVAQGTRSPTILSPISGFLVLAQLFELYPPLLVAATLSLMLGFLQLLPLPVFDGGWILSTLAEPILGKQKTKTVSEAAYTVSWVALGVAMTLFTLVDLYRFLF